ncbi:MAG TPA: ATP-binding protein [Thermomicrobiales bacterium]|nr:ATP-binding protein [Thermomicrobiales bacterium]
MHDDERAWADGDGAPAEGPDGAESPPAENPFAVEAPHGPRPTAHDPRIPPAESSFAVATADALAEPDDFSRELDGDVEAMGGELAPDPDFAGAVGATMFDLPSSEDGTVTALLPKEQAQAAPAQALVRIKSRDGRRYIGVVAAGPFAEPDSLRGDSPMLVTVATRGGLYLPPYHGRVQLAILGEEGPDGALAPPRLRPLPNSAVFALSDDEAAAILHADGDIRLGLAVGYDALPVGIPSKLKSVLPRHTAVLGTTGGGKSTTIAGLVQQAQAAKMAVILLDVEGEYTCLHEPTADPRMLGGLAERGLAPAGVPADRMTLYHLVGRETANPDHPDVRPFSLQFARLSPYTAAEILGLTEAQATRFHTAYDIAKALLRELDIFPRRGDAAQQRLALELDEFERGYPRLTLQILMDVVGAVVAKVAGETIAPYHPALRADEAKALKARIGQLKIDSPTSWRALLGKLARLNRLKVFDRDERSDAKPLVYTRLLEPGRVSVIDLSDTSMSELSNLVIADLLRGVQDAQDAAYEEYEAARAGNPDAAPPARTLVIVEEAHEFLSAERIEQMPILFGQVARIAKRGRKRWLGLVFVTQFPQHLPRQVLGLVNGYVIHKVTDPQVVTSLQRIAGGVDDGLWRRLPNLAPGQAIVTFPHLARPLLVSVDPAPAKLRLID